nr:TMV resistance protein N-like [Ipomoea batatas]
MRSVEDPSSSKIKEFGENSGMLTSLRRLDLRETNIQSLPSNTSHLLKPPKSISNLRRNFSHNDYLKLVPQFPPNLEDIILEDCQNLEVVSATLPTCLKEIILNGCKNLKMLPKLSHTLVNNIYLDHSKNLEVVSATTLPTCLKSISLFGCTNLKMLPELPHTLAYIWLKDCKNLKMLPQLPQNLLSLYAINCELLETVHLPKMLTYVNLTHCKKLKEIQGWENAHFLTEIKLRGVPCIKFSENINQVLKVSKWNCNIEFEGNLPNNETLSWIKFEENGSSFQWPPLISNLEFLGICIWVLTKLCCESLCVYYSAIEKDGFGVFYRSTRLIILSGYELLEEGGNDLSLVDFIPGHFFKDIKIGEIFKVISKFEDAKKGMIKKIRVEALFRDREEGFLQFLPLTKLDSNTQEEKEEEDF